MRKEAQVDDFGITLRPTPTSQGKKALEHEHSPKDKPGYKAESKFVRCKICGFIANKGRDSQCPFCESTRYNK